MTATTPTNPTAPTSPEGLPPSGVEGLFPHVIAPDVDNSAPSNTAPAAPSNDVLAALQNDFQTFRQEAQQREARLTETIQTLMMRPAPVAPQAQVAPQPSQFDLSDLPDPVQNPKAYNEALQAKLSGYIEQSSQTSQQALLSQMTSAQALNGVYAKLQGQHPDLAKRQILLQGAATAEFSQLRAQGIDPIAVAQSNPDGLVANIVNRMNAELGLQTGTAPIAPGGSNAARANVGGASQPTAPTTPTAPKALSFVDQLKRSQVADGLI